MERRPGRKAGSEDEEVQEVSVATNNDLDPSPSELRWRRKKKVLLFNSPEMDGLADQILQLDRQKGEKGFLEQGRISWGKFEDGFPNLFIHDVESVEGMDVVFVVSFLDRSSFLAHLSVMFALPRYLVRSLLIILPYYPTGTMERVDSEGQIATAYTLARILSLIPLTQSGPSKVLFYDIHALPNRFYFRDTVVPLLVTAIPQLVAKLREAHKGEKVGIAFPDEGASKRFAKYFDNEFELVTCTKIRQGDRRIVSVKDGDPEGKHMFIIDDLTKTGGTLIECQQVLLSKGASAVSAYVTHAVFPEESWKKFTNPKSGVPFKKVYITDSCPESANVLKGREPFEIIPLAPSVYHYIQRFTQKTSAAL